MNVPLLDLRAQLDSIETEVKSAVNKVIDSTRYIMGLKVKSLEESVPDYCGV